MESKPTTDKTRYSLVIPWVADQAELDRRIDSLCEAFEKETDASYEILAVDHSNIKDIANDIDRIKGEILIVLDGELDEPPALLKELIDSFEKGADLALSGHYAGKVADDQEPAVVCFGIRRSALPKVKESPEGFGLALNILGPEAIKRMSGESDKKDGYMANYLKHLIKFS